MDMQGEVNNFEGSIASDTLITSLVPSSTMFNVFSVTNSKASTMEKINNNPESGFKEQALK